MNPREELAVADIRLSDPAFWKRDEDVIDGAFMTLRREAPVSFHDEVALPPLFPKGPGYWSVVRHADIERVARDHTTFLSAKGIAIWDFPPEFAKAFHHMGNEDGDRHKRLRRIVSKAFNAGAMSRMQSAMDTEARRTVDRIIDKGKIEFVSEVGSQMPVRMICELIGIPERYHEMVFVESSKAMTVADPSALAGADDAMAALAASAKPPWR